MEPFVFFLLGLPVAYFANRAVLRLTEHFGADEDEVEADEQALAARPLPWQDGPWPARVRIGVVALIPLLMAVAGSRFEPVQAVAVSLLVLALLVCTATDLLRFRVPNAVTYPGIVLAILATLLLPDAEPLSALIAALLGGGGFLVMSIVTRGGLGLGDVKLAALIGAALGLPAAYQALALGIIAGGVVILVLFLAGVVGRRQAVPYAPFLALAAVAVVLMRGAAFAPL
jgi:prepilin signal peptidase PulO-like enzyme (type II secretory pathway)